jgi:hypothetical protein
MVAGSPPSAPRADHASITEEDMTQVATIVGRGDREIARLSMAFLLNPLSAEDEFDRVHGDTSTRLAIERAKQTFNEEYEFGFGDDVGSDHDSSAGAQKTPYYC